MEGRNQFTFYRSFYEAVMKLRRPKQLAVLLAIVEFGLDGKEPEGLDDNQMGYFIMARPNLSSARRKAVGGAAGGRISRYPLLEKESKKEKKDEKKVEKENDAEAEAKGFAAFWARYPVHIGKAAAQAAWVSVCEQHGEECIFSGLEAWLTSKSWALEDGRFIPKAEKWLKETWFLQEPAQELPKGASGKLGQAELEAIQRLLKED